MRHFTELWISEISKIWALLSTSTVTNNPLRNKLGESEAEKINFIRILLNSDSKTKFHLALDSNCGGRARSGRSMTTIPHVFDLKKSA